ncbi:MAG: acyl-CoA thioesterase [Deltaproteobacteria bacterium]|nr:acyl-CoA thioesterase [Deltaproteobacteria bacterium]
MDYVFRTCRRVEFSDTDLGGIVHFSRFFVFMEGAEHEYLRSLGTSVDLEIDGQRAGWPRLSASLDFRSPARFEDWIDLELRVLRKGRSSITYGHTLKVGERLIAEGRISTACCLLDLPTGLKAVPIPAEIAERIAVVGE